MKHKKLTVKLKYHTDILPIEEYDKGDWIDLRAAEDVEMSAGEFKLISLGISMKLPEGYEAHLLPRSSTFKKWGIICVNSVGVIDNAYRGDNDIWKFPALCLVGKTHIPAGTRIAQFRILRNMPQFDMETVTQLDGRCRGGFGSTGD